MNTYHSYVGIDVGKTFHWVHATDAHGTTLVSKRIDQDEQELDQVFTTLTQAGPALVVVDQPKNIGALTLACARHAGCDTMFLPGLAMRRAAGILPGEAKTDARDAHVIALTARIMPEALRPVSHDPDRAELEALVAYDQDCLTDATRERNRLRALLHEVNPMFEAQLADRVDSPFVLGLLTRFGGPWGMRAAGQKKVRAWAARQKRVPATLLDHLIETAWAMARKPAGTDTKEALAIPAAARRITELDATRKHNEHLINQKLAHDPAYQALTTMPGVGPHTAATLVTTVDISLFPDHEHLASYAGLAAKTTQSGTSIKGETAARSGNKALKNALFLSAFAAVRWDPKARDFYDQKKTSGKKHNTIIIALARKRLKIMYAIMRDKTPYRT